MLLRDTEQLDDLKAFLGDWYGGYDHSRGVPADELPADLPQPLRELYAFAGRWKDGSDEHLDRSPEIFQQQDCLYAVERLRREDGRITFLEENQGNWTCQVEADNDRSPVYCDERALWDDDAAGHLLVTSSLYHFLKTFCLQEVVFGCPYLYIIEGGPDRIQDWLDRPLEPIWLNGYYTGAQEDGPTHAYYRCGEALVMERYGDFWLGADRDLFADLDDDTRASIAPRKIKPD